MAGSLLASRVALFSAARLGLVHSSRASLATSAAPAAATASYCSTFDYRRERLRSGWGISTANEDVGEFCERLGQLSEVNWALNRNKVAPTGDAFRNLHLRGLRMLIPSVKDSSANCTVVPRADAASHKSFVVLPPSAPVKEGETAPVLSVPASTAVISAQESSALLRQLRVHLSTPDSPNVFLHDGSINSGTGERLLRAITDDATVALVLRHAILPAHLGSPLTFTPNATSFLSYTLPPPTSGVAAGAGSFSVLDLAANTLVMGGKFTSTQVLEALAALANFQVAQSGSGVPLPKCHSAVTSQGVSLVFGDSQPVICAQLFGAHNNVWSKDGIARSFNAAVVQPPPSKYTYKSCDLVEKPAKGSSRLVTSHKPERGFFAPHPNRVVFVVSDAQLGTGSLFTASSKQGAALFKRHAKATIPGIDTESLTNAFGELLESCKSTVYVVKAGKDEQQTIAAATTGAQAPKLDATAFSS